MMRVGFRPIPGSTAQGPFDPKLILELRLLAPCKFLS